MSELKSTPGPWAADRDSRGVYGIPNVCDFEGDVIAIMDSGGGMFSPEEIRANLRLILAAPCLLAACMSALHEADDMSDEWKQISQQLRAAIAKATTEEPR